MAQTHILVVDDEPDIRQLMSDILEDEGYSVAVAKDGEAARTAFAEAPPDLVLLDIWMPDVDGITLLKEWSESGRLDCPVVMISGHGTLETAVEATRLGAYDFVEKPLSLAKLLATVKQALGSKPAAGRRPAGIEGSAVFDPQGISPQMQLLRQKAQQAARHDSPVLISGENGTGKEVLAAYIHRSSGRSGGLTIVDAVQLGGNEARAYLLGSGPGEDRTTGVLEAVGEGTLFIPEIQALEPDAQALLGTVLESGRFTPEGDSEARKLNCRIIASVTGDVGRLVEEGRIGEPLYLQLNVLPLHIAALRERPEDVPELVRFYADWFSNAERLPYRSFSISALNRLRNYPWPGNERELRNLVERLLVMGGEGDVSVQEIEDTLKQHAADAPAGGAAPPGSFDLPLREAREQFEREYLIYQLRKAGGSVGKLSESVGMERTHLYRKLKSLGIDPRSVGSQGGSR